MSPFKSSFEIASAQLLSLLKELGKLAPEYLNSPQKMFAWYMDALKKLIKEEDRARQEANNDESSNEHTAHENRLVKAVEAEYHLISQRRLVRTAGILDTDLSEKLARHALRLTLALVKNSNAMMTDTNNVRNTFFCFFKALERAVHEPWTVKS